jgi:23S rRNA pseudouridine2605 synthase
MPVRLQKFLAEAGVASRRASEQIIASGRVTINGKIVRELGSKVDPARDEVAVDGVPLKAKRKLYLAVNKPPGYICSRHDPLSRRSVNDLLPKEWKNLQTIGRLDYHSEGLIFLTNDGEFSLHLTHPRYGVRKKYIVTVEGRVEPHRLAPMLQGVFHEGERLKADRVHVLAANNSRSTVEIELSEGKNREVRRLFASQKLTIERLQRVQIGPIKLGELPSGKWRTLSATEIKSLLSSGPAERKAGSREH